MSGFVPRVRTTSVQVQYDAERIRRMLSDWRIDDQEKIELLGIATRAEESSLELRRCASDQVRATHLLMYGEDEPFSDDELAEMQLISRASEDMAVMAVNLGDFVMMSLWLVCYLQQKSASQMIQICEAA